MARHALHRYHVVAIVLHWSIAGIILALLWIGFWMADAISDPARQAAAFRFYQLHKSLGLTMLVLTLARIGWRLAHPAPRLLDGMPAWQRGAAGISHLLLYAFMLGLPLSGWLYVSTGWNSLAHARFAVPTIWFGLFQWPDMPGLAGASDATASFVADLSHETHELLAWGMIALLAVHSLAALKHHFADRDAVFWSMLPILRHPNVVSGEASEESP